MWTSEDTPFEKWRLKNLSGMAVSSEILQLIARAYEGGFIDGMQKQAESSVDRAINGSGAKVSALQFVEMTLEKEHLVGKPIIWAEWPSREKS